MVYSKVVYVHSSCLEYVRACCGDRVLKMESPCVSCQDISLL